MYFLNTHLSRLIISRCFFFAVVFFLSSCSRKPPPLFTLLPPHRTGIDFINKNVDTDTLNILDYLYYYNGAGVAVGDLNNDGLPDIYFASNTGGNGWRGAFSARSVTSLTTLLAAMTPPAAPAAPINFTQRNDPTMGRPLVFLTQLATQTFVSDCKMHASIRG